MPSSQIDSQTFDGKFKFIVLVAQHRHKPRLSDSQPSALCISLIAQDFPEAL